ncbi:hypothetical protein D3C79_731510 [compost metagenome]
MLKVIGGNAKHSEPTCTIKFDSTVAKYDEFISFGYNEQTGDIEIAQSADALTLLKSLIILQQLATEAFNALEPEVKEEVRQLIWGGANEDNT